MFAVGLFAAAALGSISGVGLSYRDGAFVMTDGADERRVILRPAVAPPQTVFAQKLGKTWMVWDQRGLTVRTGTKVASTRFSYMPTSPKVMSREQIGAVVKLFEKGDRQKDASGLAGHQVVGDTLFLLVRWADAANKPWLEVLVKVDTTAAEPKPEFVTKMPGVSLATGEIDDQLFKYGTKLASLSTLSGDWGISAMALEDGATTFTKYGHGLVSGTLQRETQAIYFVDRTGYGTLLAGQVDLEQGVRTNVAESRGSITFVSTKPPVLRVEDPRGVSLRYVETGADVQVPENCEARMTGIGLLTWAPKDQPQRAVLYEPTRWIPISTWAAPLQSATAAEPGPKPATEAKVEVSKPTSRKSTSAASMALAAAAPKSTVKKSEPKVSEPKKVEPKRVEPKKAIKKPSETARSEPKPTAKKKPRKPVVEVSVKKKGS